MSLHKVTLIVDRRCLEFLNRISGHTLPGETFTWLEVEDLPTTSCPTCGDELVAGDAIPCDKCGVDLCHWCQDNPDIPCTGKEL